ncbi:DUF58 domain-containing protein [Mobilitalea sibirica]|uniref:DUF58 domain-containing protein n=1 Tax=Mobilitalea sibirica TaxID=1462919 RepID=A0A8J7H3K2_9FIRM|nr:DUF58 domain-containing protein [Mobilitalea sibirica]MBH1941702.1 DUF58 domain-containing protein [Mobilitalea sibirica]
MLQNKIRYLMLLASVGLLSILYNEYVMGIIFLTVAVIPFIMFGILSYIYGMISAELVSVVHVAGKGETIPVTVQINNPTVFPIPNLTIYLSYRNTFSNKKHSKDITVSVNCKTSTGVIFHIQSEHAGNLEVSLAKLRIFDYLRMFSLRKSQKGEVKIAILPKMHEISEEYIINRNKMLVESDVFSQVKSGDDPSEVFAIREYREGDRPQRIHWKLSVKQNQLMIKDFSEPLNCSILIFANLSVSKNEDTLIYMDALLECALSLSYSFMLKGQIHYFSWYDETHGICRRVRIVQEKDLFEAVDGLLQSGPYTEGMDVIPAYLSEHPNDQYTDLFYVTGEVSTLQLNSLLMMKASDRQVIYVHDTFKLFNDDNKRHNKLQATEELLSKMKEMGIGFLTVDTGNVKATMEHMKLV